jgi:hypothetical protein
LAQVLEGPLVPEEPAETYEDKLDEITATPIPDVLSATDEKGSNTQTNYFVAAWVFAGLGIAFIFIYLAKQFIIKKS